MKIILVISLALTACTIPRSAPELDPSKDNTQQSGLVFTYKYNLKTAVIDEEGCEFQLVEQPSNLNYQFHLDPKKDHVVVNLPAGTYFLRKLNCYAMGVFDFDNAAFSSAHAREMYDRPIYVGKQGFVITTLFEVESDKEVRTRIAFFLNNWVDPKFKDLLKGVTLQNPYSLPLQPVDWSKKSKKGYVVLYDLPAH